MTQPQQFTISCRKVWKIFGPNPGVVRPLLNQGLSRSEILAQTGHVIAVRDVSFDVRPGEIFVVMGLSGSGKSTLIRCLSRLIEPTEGEIVVDGQNVVNFDAAQLRELRRHKMSMVFQRFGLFPHRTILDNVSYGLEIQGIKKEPRYAHARQVLEMVGLKGWETYYPHELSGGMQQRVGLARALAVDPEILLCDEPFSALDPLIRREMQDELLRLQKTLNKTLVFITHDFLEALKLGHHIAIMKDGEIVQLGKPEEIVAHPVNDYVREFTRDVPRVKILTAKTIMTVAATEAGSDHVSVHADTTLESLIGLTAVSDDPLVVLDDEGCVIGMVTRTAVLQALSERSQPNSQTE
ncbi:MAG: glycine betaine/L-proline ABC transporter ATP-binding protein [Ardenticatenaceae bacterium]|nr:glycine betaine/L-proline ABC transporter ATP-binding protein [Ardenticatenaceae bacterium]